MIASSNMTAFELGFAPAAAALLSLGPQNTLLLRRGFSGRSALVVFGICYGCELGLVLLGTMGVGAVADAAPVVSVVLQAVGMVYLAIMSLRCFARAGVADAVAPTETVDAPSRIVFTALMVSALNPLAWLESVLVVGAVASSVQGELAIVVAAGAWTGALCRFGVLGLGGRLLRPMFGWPRFRRAFDAMAGVVMAAMAGLLFVGLVG